MMVPVCVDSALKWDLSAKRGNVNKRLCFNSADGGRSLGRGNKHDVNLDG